MNQRLTAVFAVLVMVVVSVSATMAQSSPTLRIGISTIEVSAEPFYAADMGFFAKNGLTPDIQVQPNAAVTINALVSGDIDVGAVGINNLEQAHAKGLAIVAIAPASGYDAAKSKIVTMLVRNGAAIESAKDFEGKTVGTFPLRSMGELAMDLWIDKNGGDSSKVKYIEIPFPATAATLQEGRIDGAIGLEPFTTQAKPFAHQIGPDPFAAIGNVWAVNVFVATKAWAQAHPDLVRRFAATIRDTADWANKNPDKAVAIFAKNTKADIATINSSARPVFLDALSAPLIQPTIDLRVRYKQIDAPFKPEELIYQAPK
jgi:NitT/TauT family transport system substrate-binding protein